MNKDVKASLRIQIEAEIETLRETIAALEEGSKPVAPDSALGRLTRMEALGARAVSQASLQSVKDKFNQLTHALERIDQEGFGVCNVCKEPLPPDRIIAVPNARICVPCQTKLMQEKK
jgi:DnaK suppressor protein